MRMMKVVCLGLAGAMVFGASAAVSTQTLGNLNRNSTVVTGVSGFATTQELANHTNTLNQTGAAVAQIWTYVYGGSAWFSMTNFMRTVEGVVPQLSFWEIRDGNTNQVYSVAEEVEYVMGPTVSNLNRTISGVVQNVETGKADRAWSKYQSVTGHEAPEGVTVVQTPTTMLAAGYDWQKYVDVNSNSVWLLQNTGLYSTSSDTNSYFQIVDDEGNVQFKIVKTENQLISVVPSEVGFTDGGDFFVKYPISTPISPVAKVCYDLTDQEWKTDYEDDNVTMSWTSSGGVYTLIIHQTTPASSLFVTTHILQEGGITIQNNATSSFEGGILIDGIKYRLSVKTISGTRVLGVDPM